MRLPSRRRFAGCRRALLLVALLMVIPQQGLDGERLPTRIYSTADGLAHNTVTRIVRDSEGFLWFCTPDGFSRFDGSVFLSITTANGLPAGAVNDLLQTGEGDYWAATDSGLVHLARASGTVVRQSRPRTGSATAKLPLIVPAGDDARSSAITVLRQMRDGRVWVGTRNGLFHLDSDAGAASLRTVDIGLPDVFPEQQIISDLLEDRQGTIWIATPAGLYGRRPDGTVRRYTATDVLPSDYVSSLLEDREGALWVGTRSGGFYRLRTDVSGDQPVADRPFSEGDGLPSPWVTGLFESSDGRFWVTSSEGLAELLPSVKGARRVIRPYAARQGVAGGYLGAIGEDANGNVWIGSHGSGAVKLTREGFTTYAAHDGIAAVNGIFEDRVGNVCFRGLVLGDGTKSAFEGALLELVSLEEPKWVESYGCYDGSRFTWFQPAALKSWGWARDGVTVHSRDDEWWIGSQEGVTRFPPARRFADLKSARPLQRYTTGEGLAANQIFRLFEDSRGDIWISTISSVIRGLARYERRSGQLQDLARLPGLPSPVHDVARVIVEDRAGNVWLSFNTGLARYSSGGGMTFFTPRDGLPAGSIGGMHVDRAGRLWLASSRGGLVQVDQPSSPRPTFRALTTADGLSSNHLTGIAEDHDGHLYVGGGHGIDRVDTSSGRIRNFSQADGLVPGILTSAYTDRRGTLWFGMTTGLARLEPEHVAAPRPPPVFISGLRVTGEEYVVSPLGDRHLTLGDLSPAQRQIEVEFVAIGFAPGEALRYQYKFEGGGWSRPTPRRVVHFASLSPGAYVFSVQAVNADGQVSPVPATLSFTILRPMWQQWWFLTLSTMAAAGAVGLMHRYRVSRLLEMANMRTHIATDLHDDIGANLTRIALLSEAAQRTQEQTALVSIAAIARESVSSMSDIVWAISPRRETLLDLTRRMRQHADELFTLRGIALRFDAPASGETRLGVDVRRDLLLIFKEAVNNAARHSACTAVEISIVASRGKLTLTIRDDGIGFDPWAADEGHGLASMRRRAERMRGVLRIRGAAGSGTVLTLEVPL